MIVNDGSFVFPMPSYSSSCKDFQMFCEKSLRNLENMFHIEIRNLKLNHNGDSNENAAKQRCN